MAETLPPEAASVQTEPGQGTSPFSEKYDPKRVDYIVQKEGGDVVIRDPLRMNEETKEYEVVGRLTGTKEGPRPGVSAQAEALRSITSQVPDAERDIRNQFIPPEEPKESPVSGLTAEDVALFEKSGTTVEQLNEIIKEHGLEDFLAQAEKRLQVLREQAKTALTPEQLAEKQARERAEKIKQLEAERARLNGKTANTKREKTLLELNRLRINAELENLGGGGGGGGSEGLGSKEGEPIPPDLDLEYEASPERGRQIALAIQEQTAKLYAGKLKEVDWPKLDQAYMDQRIHTEAARLVKARIKVYEAEEQTPSTSKEILKVNEEAFRGFRSLAEWLKEYNEGTVTDWDRFNKEVDTYFAEAQRVNLLKDLNNILAAADRNVRQGIGRELASDDIMFGIGGAPGVEHKVQNAVNAMLRASRIRRGVDLGLDRLAGVGQLYAQRALDRFAAAIIAGDSEGITQEGYLDHEFHLGQEGENVLQETFWKATHGWYIEVSAQAPEEFEIAADSYISTLESITADPKEILDQSQQFIRVLTQSDGAQKLLQTEEGKAFINRLTFRIQSRVAVFGANDANERYQNDNYKAYMDYENKDGKGPDRYLELIKYLDGLPAGVLWALDKDPRWEILFSLHGPKGELSDASPAQRAGDGSSGLYNQLYDLLVEEMLGVAIKNKKNLGNLSKFTSDETFASNFDGLYMYGRAPEGRACGDINIRAYQTALVQTPDGIITPAHLLDRRVRLGKIQVELNDLRERITRGEKFTKANGQSYDPSADEVYDLLKDPSDTRFYQSELAKVKKAVDIAMQIYGALGEKSKRGGGVFKTEKKIDAQGRESQYFVPVHMAEKFVQCGVTLTKIKYADDAPIWNGQNWKTWNDAIAQEIKRKNREAGLPELKNFKAQYRTAKVLEAEERAIVEFRKNGYEAKLYDEDGKSMKIKRPKEDPKTEKVLKDVEEVDADFYTATHHIYGNWSGHTYWSYQEEDRHMMLSDVTFAKAKAVRDGKLRPQDADMWTEQLLILDPTLKRVRRFTKDFEDRERKLTMAAVEDSYQGHWRITEGLYKSFFPEYGTPTEEIGIYYGLQDFGGFRKMVEHARARAAEDPERFARRGRRLIPYLRIPISPLSEYLGQGTRGVLGAIMMFDAPIYKGAGTFALDKLHAQAEIAFKLYEALFIASKDEQGNIVEPLLLKLTNESDTNLQAFFQKYPKLGEWWTNPAQQQEFCVAVRKSFGRLERYEKLLATMETMIRNASGAQLLENVDILTDDGELGLEVDRAFRALPDINKQDLTTKDLVKIVQGAEKILRMSEDEWNSNFNSGVDDKNPGIDEGSTSVDTGSGRHGARFFHNKFFEIFLDEGKRGGFETYPTERFIYKHLKDMIVYINPEIGGSVARRTYDIIAWLFTKFVPT